MKNVVNGYNEGLSFPVFQNSTYYCEYVTGKTLSEMTKEEYEEYTELFLNEYENTSTGWWVLKDEYNANVEAFLNWYYAADEQAAEETQETTPEPEDPVPSYFPIEEYTGWAYPVTVEVDAYPTGVEEITRIQITGNNTGDLELQYYELLQNVMDGNWQQFKIIEVKDANNEKVYEYEPQALPEENQANAVAASENVETALETIVENDSTYYDRVYAEMKIIQDKQDVIVSTNIIMSVGVYAILSAIIIITFIGRLK